MRTTLLTITGLVSLALALPPGQPAPPENNNNNNNINNDKNNNAVETRQQPCLDDSAAQKVAENFRTLITDYSNASAAAFLTEDFLDYSDGVNTLINKGCPNGVQALGAPTFTSLVDFQAGQGSQPNIPFDILNVWQGCDFVTMRWRSSAPEANGVQPQEPVTGVVVLEVCQGADEPWVIDTVYSEFNSGAWLYDLGAFVPTCDNTQAKTKRGFMGSFKML